MELVTDQALIDKLNQKPEYITERAPSEEEGEPQQEPGFFSGISNAPKHASQSMHAGASMLGEMVADGAQDADMSRYHRMKAWKNIQEKQKLEKEMGTLAHVASGAIQSLPQLAGYVAAGPAGGAIVGGLQSAGDLKTEALEVGKDISNAEVVTTALGSGLVDATIGKFIPTGASPMKRVLSDTVGAAASGAQDQVWRNLALGKDWNENVGTAAVAGGALGGGVSGLNAALNIPLNKGGEGAVSSMRKIEDADTPFTPDQTFKDEVFEYSNAVHDFEDRISRASTPEQLEEAINAKLNADVKLGASTAFADAMEMGSDIPFTAAMGRFDIKNIDKTKDYGNAGEKLGQSRDVQKAAADKNEQAKATGFRIGAAQKKGYTPESHKEQVKIKGTDALNKALGTFVNNKSIANKFKDIAERDGSSEDVLKKYRRLASDLGELEKLSVNISKGQADVGTAAINAATSAYKNAADLGLLREFEGLNGKPWNPISNIQSTEFLEKAIVNEFPSFHYSSPDTAKEIKSPFKVDALDAVLGMSGVGIPAMIARKIGQGVTSGVTGAVRKSGFKNRVADSSAARQGFVDFAKTPQPRKDTPEPTETTVPTPPDPTVSRAAGKDFDDAASAGDLEGMVSAAEADLNTSGYSVAPRTSSPLPANTPAVREVAEEIVETPVAPTPQRQTSLSPDPIRSKEVEVEEEVIEPDLEVPDTISPEETPGFIRRSFMDAMSPKELKSSASKLDKEVDKAKDELITNQNKGMSVTSEDLAKIQGHLKALKANADEARKVAEFKEKQETEEAIAKANEQAEAAKAKEAENRDKVQAALKRRREESSRKIAHTPASKPGMKRGKSPKKPKPTEGTKPVPKTFERKAPVSPSKPKVSDKVVVDSTPEVVAPESVTNTNPSFDRKSTVQIKKPKKPDVIVESDEVLDVPADEKTSDNIPYFQIPAFDRVSTVSVKKPKQPEPVIEEVEIKDSDPYVDDGEVLSEKEFIKSSKAVPVTKVWEDTVKEVDDTPLISRTPALMVEYNKAKTNIKKTNDLLDTTAEETPESREVLVALMNEKNLSVEDPNFKKKLKNAAKEYRLAQANQGAGKVQDIIDNVVGNVKKKVDESSTKELTETLKTLNKKRKEGEFSTLTPQQQKALIKQNDEAVQSYASQYNIPEEVVNEAYMIEGVVKGEDLVDPLKIRKQIGKLNTSRTKKEASDAIKAASVAKKDSEQKAQKDIEDSKKDSQNKITNLKVEISHLETALSSKKKNLSPEQIVKIKNDIQSKNGQISEINKNLGDLEAEYKNVVESNKKIVAEAESARKVAEEAEAREVSLKTLGNQAEDIKGKMIERGYPEALAEDFIRREFAYKEVAQTPDQMNAIYKRADSAIQKDRSDIKEAKTSFLKDEEKKSKTLTSAATEAKKQVIETVSSEDSEVVDGLAASIVEKLGEAFNSSREEYTTLKAMLDGITEMKDEAKQKLGSKQLRTVTEFKKAVEEIESLRKQYPDDRRMWLPMETYKRVINTISDDFHKTWYGNAGINLRAVAYGYYGDTPSHGVWSKDLMKEHTKKAGLKEPVFSKNGEAVTTEELLNEIVSQEVTKSNKTVKVRKVKKPITKTEVKTPTDKKEKTSPVAVKVTDSRDLDLSTREGIGMRLDEIEDELDKARGPKRIKALEDEREDLYGKLLFIKK